MDYEHDLFISYRRQEDWTPWTRQHLGRLLRAYLQQELQRPPDIFIDEHLEVGKNWVNDLAEHLAKSRVMVAIFSADYFSSPWCLHELDLMLERWKPAGAANPVLIFPIVAHDGELIPATIQRLQTPDIKRFRIAGLIRDTPLYQDFSQCVNGFAPGLAKLIQSAPPFDAKWIKHHQTRLNKVFDAWHLGQGKIQPTKQFKLPLPQLTTKPPRPEPEF